MADSAEHWEGVYTATPSTDASWFEREPATSIRLIAAHDRGSSAVVIDVGGGASLLVDHLVTLDYTDVTVLDVSGVALDEARKRLGNRCEVVTFVQHDVLTWKPDRRYDVWHDRAMFHFLVDRADRDRYAQIATLAVPAGGRMVLATFAEDGPTECSGLAVCPYSAEKLAGVFAADFSLVGAGTEEHVTPRGTVVPFTWVELRRR